MKELFLRERGKTCEIKRAKSGDFKHCGSS
jgi:hypothetical protein